MTNLLDDLKREWEKNPAFKDVEAEYWVPGAGQAEKCQCGCKLKIYEDTPTKWGRVLNHDAYRQTRICRE